MTAQHMNYLRRKTADESELWAADRIEQLEAERAELKALLKEGANGFGRILVATSDDAAVRNWQKRARAAIAKGED